MANWNRRSLCFDLARQISDRLIKADDATCRRIAGETAMDENHAQRLVELLREAQGYLVWLEGKDEDDAS